MFCDVVRSGRCRRTPSAAREAAPRLRYSSPVGASPSRSLDHRERRDPRDLRDRASADHAHLPTYNGECATRTHTHMYICTNYVLTAPLPLSVGFH